VTLYQIGEVCALTGVTRRTLRYYHEIGLLAPRAQAGSGARLYAAEELERIEQIKALQRLLGLSLRRIKRLLADPSSVPLPVGDQETADLGRYRAARARAILAVEAQLGFIRERRSALLRLERQLDQRVHALRRWWREVDAMDTGEGTGGQA